MAGEAVSPGRRCTPYTCERRKMADYVQAYSWIADMTESQDQAPEYAGGFGSWNTKEGLLRE